MTPLPVVVLLPLAAAPLPTLLHRAAGVAPARTALGAALATVACALALLLAVRTGAAAIAWPWIPALGVGLALRADGLAAGVALAVAAGGALGVLLLRRRPSPVPAARYGSALVLCGATLGTVLADDLGWLWCCLELAALAALRLAAAGAPPARRGALAAFVATEAGGLAFFAALLLVADGAGSLGIGAALAAGGMLRAQPLSLPLTALLLAAAASRLAPLLAARTRGAVLAGGAGAVAAVWLPLRLAPLLGGTRAWPVVLGALAVASVALAAIRGARARPAAPKARPSLLDDVALGARLAWQPLAAPGPGLTLAALAAGIGLAAALALEGVRADAWPAAGAAAWPLVVGCGWLLLAVVAGLVRGHGVPLARALALGAAAAAALLAAGAPAPVAAALLIAGLPAGLRVARALALPRPSARVLAAFGGALLAIATLRLVAVAPPAAATPPGAGSASVLALAPLLLPLGAGALLRLLGADRPGLARGLAGLALVGNVLLAAALAALADHGAPLALALGVGPAPFGLHLLLDRLAAAMLVVAAAVAALVHAPALVRGGGDARGHARVQLQLAALAGCVLAADLLELILFAELLLLTVPGPQPPGGDGGGAARAGAALEGAAGGAVLLLAAGGVYATLGSFGLAELGVAVPALAAGDAPLLRLGAYALLVVLALRAGALPLGLWLARACPTAPPAAAAGVVAQAAVGVYALLRLYTLVFPCFGAGPCGPSGLVLPLGLATLVAGGVGALGASGLRGIAAPLAYVAIGTLLVGVGSFREAGVAAALFVLGPAALAGCALALAGERAGEARGPAAAALAAALGLPPFAGWIGRLAILGASGADALVVWSLVLSTALLAALGAARLAGASGGTDPAATQPADWPARAAAVAALALLAALTLAAGPLYGYATRTARQLFDRQSYIATFRSAATGDGPH